MDGETIGLSEQEQHFAERAAHLEETIKHLKDIEMHGVDDRVDVHNILGGGGLGVVLLREA